MPNAHGRRPSPPQGHTGNRRPSPPPKRPKGRSVIDGCAVVALALGGGLVIGLAGLAYGAAQVVLAL